jgi:4-hydroxy-tetrahydrodipicolinate reductase
MSRTLTILGSGPVAEAAAAATKDSAEVALLSATISTAEAVSTGAECVLVTAECAASVDEQVVELLTSGMNVIAIAELVSPEADLLRACRAGRSTLLHVDLHRFMVERMVLTMVQGMGSVSSVRFVEAIDRTAVRDTIDEAVVEERGRRLIAAVARDLFEVSEVEVRVESERARSGTTTLLQQRGYVGEHHFFTDETCIYDPEDPFHGDDLPFGGFTGPLSYTVKISGEPADSDAQWEFDPNGSPEPMIASSVRLALDAVEAVCVSQPGILHEDPRPRYQHDDRVHR